MILKILLFKMSSVYKNIKHFLILLQEYSFNNYRRINNTIRIIITKNWYFYFIKKSFDFKLSLYKLIKYFDLLIEFNWIYNFNKLINLI
jgi:hypothetical protein